MVFYELSETIVGGTSVPTAGVPSKASCSNRSSAELPLRFSAAAHMRFHWSRLILSHLSKTGIVHMYSAVPNKILRE